MTVLLVLFTLLILLGIDYLLHRPAKSVAADVVPTTIESPPFALPENVVLTKNHTWLRQEADGTITLGLDRFLTKAIGTMKEVVLPAEGCIVTHATSDIALAAEGNRLFLESPAVGRVVAVNRELTKNLGVVGEDPYNKGWLMKIRLIPELDRSRDFLVERPAEWLRDQFERAAQFFGSRNTALGIVTMQDGGELLDGLLASAETEVWGEFKANFASLSKVASMARAER